jgi:hypothetical protein
MQDSVITFGSAAAAVTAVTARPNHARLVRLTRTPIAIRLYRL